MGGEQPRTLVSGLRDAGRAVRRAHCQSVRLCAHFAHGSRGFFQGVSCCVRVCMSICMCGPVSAYSALRALCAKMYIVVAHSHTPHTRHVARRKTVTEIREMPLSPQCSDINIFVTWIVDVQATKEVSARGMSYVSATVRHGHGAQRQRRAVDVATGHQRVRAQGLPKG